MTKTCKCAAHSYAECICGAWDDLNPHTLMRERDEARAALREIAKMKGDESIAIEMRAVELVGRMHLAASKAAGLGEKEAT